MRTTKRIKAQMRRIRSIWAAADAAKQIKAAERARKEAAIAAAVSGALSMLRPSFADCGIWYDERAYTILPSNR